MPTGRRAWQFWDLLGTWWTKLLVTAVKSDVLCPPVPEQLRGLPKRQQDACRDLHRHQQLAPRTLLNTTVALAIVPVCLLPIVPALRLVGVRWGIVLWVGLGLLYFIVLALAPKTTPKLYQQAETLAWGDLLVAVLAEMPASDLLSSATPGLIVAAGKRWLADEGVDPMVYTALARDMPTTAGNVVRAVQLLEA